MEVSLIGILVLSVRLQEYARVWGQIANAFRPILAKAGNRKKVMPVIQKRRVKVATFATGVLMCTSWIGVAQMIERTPAFGGPGGGAFTFRCHADSYLIGFWITTGPGLITSKDLA